MLEYKIGKMQIFVLSTTFIRGTPYHHIAVKQELTLLILADSTLLITVTKKLYYELMTDYK